MGVSVDDKPSSPRTDSAPKADSQPKADNQPKTDAPRPDAPKSTDSKPAPTAAQVEQTRDAFDPPKAQANAVRTAAAPKIDPRIASEAGVDLSISSRTTGADGQFDVAQVAFQSDRNGESGGNHNVYVRVLDPAGKAIPPEQLGQWFDVKFQNNAGEFSASPKINDAYGVKQDAWTTSQNTGAATPGYFDVPMWGHGDHASVWLEPKQVPGNPYANFGSQQVGPFDMPGNHHVNYLVTMQARLPGAAEPKQPDMPAVPWFPPSNGGGKVGDLVESVYQSELGRASDPRGMAQWTQFANELQQGGAGEGAIRAALVGKFHQSEEYQAKFGDTQVGDLVESMYQTQLGRASDTPGKLNWMGYAEGLKQQGLGMDQIRSALVDQFQHSVEYQQEHAAGALPSQSGSPVDVSPVSSQPQPTAPVSAPSAPVAPSTSVGGKHILDANGQPQNFIAGNYTDLGRGPGGMPDPADPAMRQNVAQDLDRLKQQGVQTVRVWANPPYAFQDADVQKMADRVKIIADEAGKRGMRVTVDLIDSSGCKDVREYQPDHDFGRQLQARISTVVAQNRGAKNVDWSIGNEIGDFNNPAAFAGFYEQTAAKIRAAGGPGQKIVTELTPGAVGHPMIDPRAMDAMRRIVAASDVVGIHFYPPTGPQNYPGPDLNSLQAWNQLAKAANKPLVIGEFSVDRTQEPAKSLGVDGYVNMNREWLQTFHDMGIQQVQFWQFLKDEGGHTDPVAVDYNRHSDFTNGLLDMMRNEGWLARKPA